MPGRSIPMIVSPHTIVFAPKHNRPGRSDATGAFIPEATRFLARHGLSRKRLQLIDNTGEKSSGGPARMRKQVLDVLAAQGEVDEQLLTGVMFFCHGWKTGLQLGFRIAQVRRLAEAIAAVGGRDVRVCLYACNAGKNVNRDDRDDLEQYGGNGGFADRLRDALCEAGAVDCCVDAHTTAGHATRNPNVRRFEGMGSPTGGSGGYYIVHRTKPQLWRKWRTALRSGMRYDFPFMETSEILAGL
jgi:hypothetical protein